VALRLIQKAQKNTAVVISPCVDDDLIELLRGAQLLALNGG